VHPSSRCGKVETGEYVGVSHSDGGDRMARQAEELRSRLASIDGRGYKSYKTIAGTYVLGRFTLYIDYVQGDPFASPSRLRARVTQDEAGFPPQLHSNAARRIGLQDYLTRRFHAALQRYSAGRRGSGKSGLLAVDRPGQEILERTSCVVNEDFVEVRLVAGLPARGRTVLGRQACDMLLEELPRAVSRSLFFPTLPAGEVQRHVQVKEDQVWARDRLRGMGLVAFLADGSLLPRESGVSDLPLSQSRAVQFESPSSLRVAMEFPHSGRVPGMGVPEGVTLVVGGGFHGKSTLLRAVERGIYDHIPDDGRDRVVTRSDAVKIRAEDGRQVTHVNISPFINDLPGGQSTDRFTTASASGSTSQAANIMEALEVGAQVLLMDEDTSATNFMIRDMRMQRLVPSDCEPITPFLDRVRQLHRERGISTVIVMGGAGDYFDVADTVIMMDHYLPRDATSAAHRVATEFPSRRVTEGFGPFGPAPGRVVDPGSIDPARRGKTRVKARGLHAIEFGRQNIDLSMVEQLVDESQTRAVGDALVYLKRYLRDSSLAEALLRLESDLDDGGLDILSPHSPRHPGDYARPRSLEIAAALNRLRNLRIKGYAQEVLD